MSTRVLLADDNDAVRGALATALTRSGFTVTAVDDGGPAIALAETHVFDVVLVDVKKDGGTVHVEKSGPDLVIRVVSPAESVEIAVPLESVRRLMRKLEA